ncbi:hypothetical protein IWQ51_005173 [Labrenzia sp. EL_142]|nr:hypothetical protein [Labrenzia sp. EL_142]
MSGNPKQVLVAFPAQKFLDYGVDENLHVNKQRAGLDIFQIVLKTHRGSIGVFRLAAETFDLGQTGYAGLHLVAGLVARVENFVGNAVGKHARNMRARADKRHFAFQDIHQLRQFIEVASAQEASDRRNPGVILGCLPDTGLIASICIHRTEFVCRENLAVETMALLFEEHRTFACQFDCRGKEGKEWQQNNKSGDSTENIEPTLRKLRRMRVICIINRSTQISIMKSENIVSHSKNSYTFISKHR